MLTDNMHINTVDSCICVYGWMINDLILIYQYVYSLSLRNKKQNNG